MESNVEDFSEKLPWYLIDPDSTFSRVQNTQVQIMTWGTLVITPLVLALDKLETPYLLAIHGLEPIKDRFIWLEWLVDISWSVEILLNFFTVDEKSRTLKARASAYLWSYFVFDIVATLPPMVTGQQYDHINVLKMLRLVHVLEIFEPFQRLIDLLMHDKIRKQKENIFQLIVLFASALLGAHICACVWIAMGTIEGGWYKTKMEDTFGCEVNPVYECWEQNSPIQIYEFCLYWILTVFTTVGYGDYAGGNSREFVATIIFEFGGLMFFSLLTGLITPLVAPLQDFDGMMTEKLNEMNLWIKKL